MAMRNRRVRLLTVVGPGGRQDVVASAEASLVYLLPVFVELVGAGQAEPTSPRWSLYDVDGRLLRRVSTLQVERVIDGDVLTLGLSKPDGPPPVPYPSLPVAVQEEPEEIREY